MATAAKPMRGQLTEEATKIAVGPSAPPMIPISMKTESPYIMIGHHSTTNADIMQKNGLSNVVQNFLISLRRQLAGFAFFAEVELGEFCVRAFDDDLSIF